MTDSAFPLTADREASARALGIRARDAVLAAIAASAAMLRIALIFRYRIDSDETQHLHVVWGYTRGLLQYRDLFDNHMPLFHIASIPLLLMTGERPEALIAGRLLMLPIFAAIVLLAYRIAASCNSKEAAMRATALAVLVPLFFLCSLEYRPDSAWAACWLGTLAILVGGPPTLRRSMTAGLLFGLALAISAKSLLLAVSLAGAALLTMKLRALVQYAIVFAAAAMIPLVVIAIWFATHGAWQAFLEGTVTHNLVASEHPRRLLFLIPSIAITAILARKIAISDVLPETRKKRLFLLFAAAIYGAGMVSVWPIIESEHWLPFFPAAAAAIAPLLDNRFSKLVPLIMVVELVWIIRAGRPWNDQTAPAFDTIRQASALTSRNETVIDLKGEMLFRRRAVRSVFEKITKKKITTGLLQDTVAADVVRNKTMVVLLDNASLPREGRAFLRRNFIDVGLLRVAGMTIPKGERSFVIEVPAEYALVAQGNRFDGLLDGSPYTGPRALGAGVHTITPSRAGPLTLLWSRAASMGLVPHHSST